MDQIAQLESQLRHAEVQYQRLYAALIEAKADRAKQVAVQVGKAAAKARGQVVDLPSDPVARAVIMAGRKRRNEL